MRESKNYYKDILLSDSRQKTIDNACIQRMQPGYHFGPHLHSTVELFVCVEGRCMMTVCQTQVEIEKEDYIVILQNHPHSCDVRNEDECVILQLHFHPDVFIDLFSDSLRDNQLYFLLDLSLGQKNFIQGRCSEQLYCSIRYVYEETKNKKANYQKLIDLYFAQILLLMSRDIGNTKSGDSRSNRHLLSAFEYISRHYQEKITVEKLAEYCGVTSRRLGQLFMMHLGMNVSTYITYFRINKSIELMSDENAEYSLTQLALEVGFGSLQHFSKVFKNTMNISPAKYFARLPGKSARNSENTQKK